MLTIYMTGMILGFFAAIIPGPINIEVLRRSLRAGPKVGLTFGAGAITADVIYVAAMSFGLLTLLAALPLWGKGLLTLFGGVLLTYMAFAGIFAPVPEPPELALGDIANSEPVAPVRSYLDYLNVYGTGFLLTATSPSAYGFWIAMSFPLTQQMPEVGRSFGPLVLAAGVGTAIALWILFAVSLATGLFRRLRPAVIQRVEQGLGLVMLGFAVLAFTEGGRMVAGYEPKFEDAHLPVPFLQAHQHAETSATLAMTTGTLSTDIVADEPATTPTLKFDHIELLPTAIGTSMTTAQVTAMPWLKGQPELPYYAITTPVSR